MSPCEVARTIPIPPQGGETNDGQREFRLTASGLGCQLALERSPGDSGLESSLHHGSPMRLFLLVVLCLFARTAFADCADGQVECDHGALGTQGQCWDAKAFVCKPCGKKKCPKIPTDPLDFPDAYMATTSCPQLVTDNRNDGCSGPANDYKPLFNAACGQHDFCYHGRPERKCNEQLKENILVTCNDYYVGALNEAQRVACSKMADVYYIAVEAGGHPGWVADQKWAQENCKPFLANADAMLSGLPSIVPTQTRTYAFKGPEYVRLTGRRVDDGYPKKIDDEWPGLLAALGDGAPADHIDAAANFGTDYFFFSGKRFARWNIDKDKVTKSGLLTEAPFKLKPPFSEKIDVALEWGTNVIIPLAKLPPFERVYFFNAQSGTYLRFDVSSMSVDKNYPKSTAKGWSGLTVGSAAAKMGPDAVFVSEGTFSKWDVDDDDLKKGYPRSIVEGW